jgi:flagellar basal-body rod protein FlgB
MDPISAHIIIKALDGLAMRANVTAENIANAGTPGYRPLRLTFEDALAAAATEGNAAIDAVEPRIDRVPVGTEESELRLDTELATASATSLRYTALVDLLDRQLQLEALAVKGNS